MPGNQKQQRVIVNLPKNRSLALQEPEERFPDAGSSGRETLSSQSIGIYQDCLAYEMPVKAQDTFDVKLDSKEDKGSAFSGVAGRKISRPSNLSRPTTSTGTKDDAWTSWLKSSNSVGHAKKNSTRETGAAMKGDMRTDAKRDLGTDTAKNLRTTTNPAKEQGSCVPTAASNFTFRASSPLPDANTGSKNKSPSQDARPFIDYLNPASAPSRSVATHLEEARPMNPSNGISQHQELAAVRPVKQFDILSRTSPSLSNPTQDWSDWNLYCNKSALRGRQPASTSADSNRAQIPDLFRFNNTGSGDRAPASFLAEDKTPDKPLQPELQVPPVDCDSAQSATATRAGTSL